MKILTVDVGTGTQDIALYDTKKEIENAYKLILPSPTIVLRRQIKQATREKKTIFLDGDLMGGGPCVWAIEDHLKAGGEVYALEAPAKTINDDLEQVKNLGIHLIKRKEQAPKDSINIKMGDVQLDPIIDLLANFQIRFDQIDLIAYAAFDHGNAPPNYSDRAFRFDWIKETLNKDATLDQFAYQPATIPDRFTRLEAIVKQLEPYQKKTVLMDTAIAAVKGAAYDDIARQETQKTITNIGNGHTICFHMNENKVVSIFEHHTGFLTAEKMDQLIKLQSQAQLTNQEIFEDMGHGAYQNLNIKLINEALNSKVFVCGPKRNMMLTSSYPTHFVTPFGDMMTAGCVGLLDGVGDAYPEYRDEIQKMITKSLK